MQSIRNGTWAGKILCLAALLAFFLFLPLDSAEGAVLTHRYSFDVDASDVVGGANGVLVGKAVVAGGALVLDGTNSSVQLPNDLFTNYTSISFEMWYTDAAVSNPNNQLYHFSGLQGGMNFLLSGQGVHVVGSSSDVVSLAAPAVGGTNHLIWVEDAGAQTGTIYVNGLPVATSAGFTNTPAMMGSTTNNYLGAGATNIPTSNFRGSVLEFRAYQGALSPLDAAVLDAFGPDQPQTDPGTLQDVRLVIPSPTGPGALFRATVFADFSNVTNVNISGQPDLVLTSDNTNVIAITANSWLQTLKQGTANITAVWQGSSNTVPVTVAVPQDIALIHRYGFNEQTNDWILHDSVGGANGQVFYNPVGPSKNAAFTGSGELKMTGGFGGYAALPPRMISGLSDVTIEAWVTWTPGLLPLTYGAGAWQRIFDFGSLEGSQGVNYLFLTPATDNVSFTTKSLLHTAITTNLNVNEKPRLNWTNALVTNVLAQVVVAYSPARGVMKMYLNGVPVAYGTATIPLSSIVDTNCWLGRSQFSPDPGFTGNYNEFRIYSGLMSDADVAAEYAAGPNAIGADYVLHEYPANYSVTNGITLSWGPSVTNRVLQASPVLGSGAVWSAVPGSAVLVNGRYTMTVPVTNSVGFFRLH